MAPYDSVSERLQYINVDLVRSLPKSHGFNYRWTMIDRCTRWTEAIPNANITSETVADGLIWWCSTLRSIIPHFNRGRQFVSQLLCFHQDRLPSHWIRRQSFQDEHWRNDSFFISPKFVKTSGYISDVGTSSRFVLLTAHSSSRINEKAYVEHGAMKNVPFSICSNCYSFEVSNILIIPTNGEFDVYNIWR